MWVLALTCVDVTSAAASLPADLPGPATTLNADNMATAPKPEGFRYAIIRDGLVDDVSETLLYVKAKILPKLSQKNIKRIREGGVIR